MSVLQFARRYQCLPLRCSGRLNKQNEHPIVPHSELMYMYIRCSSTEEILFLFRPYSMCAFFACSSDFKYVITEISIFMGYVAL
jgi:hypothetical protein